MGIVRVGTMSVSLDGFGAGPHQDAHNPLGIGGRSLHEWIFATRAAEEMNGREGGEEGVDNDKVNETHDPTGATVIGRNMFGPIRGSWGDESWRGWWGDNPPFHRPVFVLTHFARAPLEMEGGTTFHFVTDGPDRALERARDAAGKLDVQIGGGISTVRYFLEQGVVDEASFAIAPVILGSGERLWDERWTSRYALAEFTPGERVAHVRFVPRH